MKPLLNVFLSVMVIVNTWTCHAETNFNVFTGYRAGGEFEDTVTGEAVDLKESESIGVSIHWDYETDTQYEVIFSRQDTSLNDLSALTESQFDLSINYLQLGGVYHWPDSQLNAYLAGTIGVTYFDPDDSEYDSKLRGSFSLGLGSRIDLAEHLAINLEARGYGTLLEGDGAFFCAQGTCVVSVSTSGIWQFELQAGILVSF